jgi:ATP-dependent Clp protease ATP-binding subunit ClpA
MKKQLMLICVLAASYMIQSAGLVAQVMVSDSMVTQANLDEKTQKKVDNAKADMANDQKQLTKEMTSYEKDKKKFEKDKRAGKLSPQDEDKSEKKLMKAESDISKLKDKIAKNQAFLDKYKM